MNKRTKKTGFTMIELLVVVSIIVVLSAAGFSSYRIANKKARDGRRKADLSKVQTSLEMYRSDVGQYPPYASPKTNAKYESMKADLVNQNVINNPTALELVDPQPSAAGYNYQSDGLTYTLCAPDIEIETSEYCVYNP